MNSGDILKDFLVDTWYKVLVYVGVVMFVVSFFFEAKGISNRQLFMLAAGILLVGLGEWKNHKQESYIKPPNVYTGPAAVITTTFWRPDILGLLFDAFGIFLLVSAIWGIATSPDPQRAVVPNPNPTPTISATATTAGVTPTTASTTTPSLSPIPPTSTATVALTVTPSP